MLRICATLATTWPPFSWTWIWRLRSTRRNWKLLGPWSFAGLVELCSLFSFSFCATPSIFGHPASAWPDSGTDSAWPYFSSFSEIGSRGQHLYLWLGQGRSPSTYSSCSAHAPSADAAFAWVAFFRFLVATILCQYDNEKMDYSLKAS